MPRVDNEDFYRGALDAHGETARGVHWISTETQEVRFKVLRGFLPQDLSDMTLVDAGCGFGDLYCYLEREGTSPGRYLGLDVMTSMVETARRRTGREILICDVLRDPLPEADYYLCSGAMNNLTRDEARQFIRNCYHACHKAFVFNLLKGRINSGIYNFFLPREIKRLGEELGAEPRVQEGYLAGDFTTAFFKHHKEPAC